jgi:dihydropyrimidine dehydrogenase (NAD+) subunit PreA
MVFGFKIVQEMANGLATYLDAKGFTSVAELRGRALASVTDWSHLDLNRVSKAVIDQDKCIQCGRCHIVCEDTEHQAITSTKNGRRHFEVKEEECVGCNLCVSVCPVPECITLRDLAPGEVDRRTGRVVSATRLDWTAHPNNPLRTTV